MHPRPNGSEARGHTMSPPSILYVWQKGFEPMFPW